MRERVRHLHQHRFDAPPRDLTLIADAEATGDPALLFEALVADAAWLLLAEQLADGEAAARRALALHQHDPAVAIAGNEPNLSHLYNRLHVFTDWSGRLTAAYRFAAESLANAGADAGQGVLLADVFHSEVTLGVVGRATELYAATGWRPAFQAPGGRWAEVSIARLIASEGNARDPIARMVALADQPASADVPDLLRWHFASWGAAYGVEQAHWDLVEQALGVLDTLLAGGNRRLGGRQHAEYAVLHAEVAYARGDAVAARRHLADLCQHDDRNLALVFARAALLRATDALHIGQPAAALAALDDAVHRFDVMPRHLVPRYQRLHRDALEALGDHRTLARDLAAELAEMDRPQRRQAVVDLLGDDLTTRLDSVFDGLQAALVGHLRWEQSEVVEAISHDLAGAAALVRLSLDLVDSHPDRVATALAAATQRMRAIVDAFALLVSIERSRLRPALTAHPFATLVERVVANARPAAEAKQMTIDVGRGDLDTALVLADVGFFEMALANVVGNAIKYAPPGSPIGVRLCRLGDELCVTVSDRGPGVADDEIDAVFQRHVRGRARPTGSEISLGLGLYISRAMCELMGGRVWVETAGPGSGATFALAFPELYSDPTGEIVAA